jgi:hypothetical protein
MNNTARAVYGYLILISLTFTLSGCTAPYYGGRSAPVYFPLNQGSAGYPPQRAGINYGYGAVRTEADANGGGSGKPEARLARERLAEKNKTPRAHEKRQEEGEDTRWIDPAP